MATIFITKNDAIAHLRSLMSAFVSLKTETECSLFNKGKGESSFKSVIGYDAAEITKHSSFVGLIGTKVDYSVLVQNRLIKESDAEGVTPPDFTAAERKWGVREDGVIVTHKDETYITVHCVANNKPTTAFVAPTGQIVNPYEEKFSSWLKPKSEEGERQGLDKPIVHREFKLSSIKEYVVCGDTYKIV